MVEELVDYRLARYLFHEAQPAGGSIPARASRPKAGRSSSATTGTLSCRKAKRRHRRKASFQRHASPRPRVRNDRRLGAVPARPTAWLDGCRSFVLPRRGQAWHGAVRRAECAVSRTAGAAEHPRRQPWRLAGVEESVTASVAALSLRESTRRKESSCESSSRERPGRWDGTWFLGWSRRVTRSPPPRGRPARSRSCARRARSR